jgi:hypothetical protein
MNDMRDVHAIERHQRKTQDRFRDSPEGMRTIASELRSDVRDIRDGNDQTAMLRLAAAFEQRADAIDERRARVSLRLQDVPAPA